MVFTFLYFLSYNEKHKLIKYNILGKRIAVGYKDGVIRVIDLKTSSVLSTISSALGHSSAITAIDCYSDNNLILSADVDG